MPVIVPSVISDLRLYEGRFKPPAAIGTGTGTGEHRVARSVRHSRLLLLHGFKCDRVQRYISLASVLSLLQSNLPPCKVNLVPRQAVLLTKPHTGVDADHER